MARKGPQGGVTVRNVKRKLPPPSQPTSPASTSSSSWASSSARTQGKVSKKPRSARPSKSSKRYREKLSGASRAGGSFVQDEEIGREFEERVLDLYNPSLSSSSVSTRKLSLPEVKARDGDTFRLPGLSEMCIQVVVDHFSSKVLPRLDRVIDGERQTMKKKPRNYILSGKAASHSKSYKALLGVKKFDSGDDVDDKEEEEEEEEEDYVPSDESEGTKGGRKRKARPTTVFQASSKEEKAREDGLSSDTLNLLHDFNSYLMALLPPKLTLTLQKNLESQRPTLLHPEVLRRYFLSREKVATTRMLRVVGTAQMSKAHGIGVLLRGLYEDATTNAAVASINPEMPIGFAHLSPTSNLSTLYLSAHVRLTSSQLIPFLERCRNLQDVNLRGCISLDSQAVEVLVEKCGRALKFVNFNWTSIGLDGVEILIGRCPNLDTLKLAHVKGLTDKAVPLMMERATQKAMDADSPFVPLSKLRKLKVQGTEVGMTAICSLLKNCGPVIRSLDISFTKIRSSKGSSPLVLALHNFAATTNHSKEMGKEPFEKVNISGLDVPGLAYELWKARNVSDFRAVQFHLFRSITSYVDEGIRIHLPTIIAARGHVESPYLLRKLDLSADSTWRDGIHPEVTVDDLPVDVVEKFRDTVAIFETLELRGRDLSIVAASSDLPLSDYDGQSGRWMSALHFNFSESRFRTPNLNWNLLGVRGQVRSMDLSGTDISKESVDQLLENNPFITRLDLTGCRSIPVKERRSYLEIFRIRVKDQEL